MKVKAVIEVIAVFILTWLMLPLVALSPIGKWERQFTKYFFIEYALIIAIPVLILIATRRSLASYGVSLRNLPYHLNIALTAFLPVVLGDFPLIFVNYKQWWGALIVAAIMVAELFVIGWMLRRKPTRREAVPLAGAVLLLATSNYVPMGSVASALTGFVYYLFFVGLGEELLFRGYIQSRLNEAWGRPFQFYGVPWGWGLVITALIFGCMHVINMGSLLVAHWQPEWWWGFWTFFGGFVSGFLREKTGSIVAPAILHGLPQAISTAFGF